MAVKHSYKVVGLCLDHREPQVPGEISAAVGLKVFISYVIEFQTLNLRFYDISVLR